MSAHDLYARVAKMKMSPGARLAAHVLIAAQYSLNEFDGGDLRKMTLKELVAFAVRADAPYAPKTPNGGDGR